MREDPNGAALLEAACTVLRQEVLTALPPEKRHSALMIANAMSIALRQFQYGDTPERAELQALHILLDHAGQGMGNGADSSAELRTSLIHLNEKLARTIRAGGADPEMAQRAAIFQHLLTTTRQRVLESNPKLFAAAI